ncbi:translocation/assembly module TamB domain-containing protein [Chitinophaga rhizophila]|uniref:Translocation/assembly module TamB n=1 Tax=Chitinophaga rhizophila TaxID=2866212 RepID=A0ABS7GHH2_9BACT|nr:translocation/assembly module TamB domain-containing protein [Chitinophaga rhizophila]MBW8686102.1 translocation/assembly module TamB [Chitinophaga rhizophila]
MTDQSTNEEKHHGRPWWRWLLWALVVLLILPVMAVLLLQLHPVQDFIRRQGEQYLKKKLHTQVKIGYLRMRGWQYLELRDVYVADTSSKALLYSESLKVRYNLLAFLNNELQVNGLDWDSVLVNVYRNQGDSTFNYQFIQDAFVSKDTIPDTLSAETGTTLQFNIKDVNLSKLRLRFADAEGGMNAVLYLQSLHIDPDDLLLDEGLYAFRGIEVNGLKGLYTQAYRPKAVTAAPPPPVPADTAGTPFHLLLKKLQIKNSSFLYADEASGLSTVWRIGNLQLLNSSIDMDSTLVQLDGLQLGNTAGVFTLSAAKDTSAPLPTDSTAPNTWKVLATKAEMEHVDFKFDNNTAPAPRGAGSDPDYNHLFLYNFNTAVSNIIYQPDTIKAVLKKLEVREKSGFAVKQGRFDVLFTPQSLALQNLLLQTNKTVLRKEIAVTVPSWATMADNLDLLQLKANIDSSHISLGEWLPFVPDSRKNPSMKPLWDKEIDITTVLKGSLGKLIIETLRVADNKGNRIRTNGEIAHAADPEKVAANLPDIYIESGNKPLRSWLPPGTMPDTPRLPEHLVITGNLLGGMQDLKTQLQLTSSSANAKLAAHLVNITDSIRARYDVNLSSFKVHPGVLMYDTSMGWISGRASAAGQGYTFPGMIARAAVYLDAATYNGYTYRGVKVNGDIDKQQLHAEGESTDTSVTMAFDVNAVLNDTSISSLQANLKMDKADLYTTNWYSQPMMLKGNLAADFASLDPKRLEGKAFLDGWQVATNGQVFPIDTVALTASYQDQQYLSLTGPFGYINANGQIDYTKVGGAFGQLINKPLQPYDSAKLVKLPAGQILQWNAAISWPRSLKNMLPYLRMEQPLIITGRLNSDSSLVALNASLLKLTYDSIRVDSVNITAQIQDTSLEAMVDIAKLYHPVAPLNHTQIKAGAEAGKVEWDLLLDDIKRNPKYKLGGYVTFLPANAMDLALKTDLLLNKQQWKVNEGNHIHIIDGGPDTAQMKLSYQDQSIEIQTLRDSTKGKLPPLKATIKDFKLSTITALLSADTLLANGTLNAEALARNLDQSPLINSQVKIDSLVFRGTSVGTLDANVETPQPGQYKLAANLTGNQNDVKVDGTYDSTINATVNINNLNMASIEAFTFGNVDRMHGSADGRFTITGTAANPKILGNLHFNNAGGTITYVGTPLTLPDETISLDERGLGFNQFVIADSLGNEMVVNGRVNTRDFTNYNFNLTVNSDNFMVLGEQQNPDQLYYGPAFIDTRISVRGNMDLPRVDANVKLRDKSKVTITLPSEEPGVANREGVMVFVDKSNPIDSSMIKVADSLRFQNPRLKGINLSGNAEITPESIIRIIIDPVNGDFVEAQGTANVNATLDASSKMSLTGRYEISEGKYEMSLNQLIKRSFSIEKGSTITFSGDAMDADLDITARYTVNATAADLVQDQLSNPNMSETDRNRYRQKLPFYVYLRIKGQMLKPEISFELDMPEAEQNAFNGSVYNRLKQINQIPSELNKQVMGLLVLNQFIPEDPLAGDGGGSGDFGVSNMARQSVSKILSQQLNNLAGNLIKGVDLNFDVESREDYSTGAARETTNLKVGASKKLFNERLSVSVGSNVMLEGENRANPSSLVGDISIEYKLTKDGRYRVRVYQRNDNSTVIEGQIIETGVAFALIMDYDEFREIFQRAKSQQKSEKLRNKKTVTKK